MKVKCVKIINEMTGREETKSGWLSAGREYIVLSIEGSPGRQISLRFVGDDGHTPALYRSDQFVTVCTRVPSNWRARVGDNGFLEVSPALWLRPGFWEEYFNGSPEAVADYEAERALIVAETG